MRERERERESGHRERENDCAFASRVSVKIGAVANARECYSAASNWVLK